jgi:hypothetical protein
MIVPLHISCVENPVHKVCFIGAPLPFPLLLVLEIRKVGAKVGLVARNMLAYQRYGRPPPAGLYARPRPNMGLNMTVL